MYQTKLFTAKEILPGVHQIYNTFINPEGFMNTFSYLVEGKEKALLIDTMFGYGNLRGFVEELTDKPVLLVNTHGHFDHIGGNFDFDECWIHPADMDMLWQSGSTNDIMKMKENQAALKKQQMESARAVSYECYREMFQEKDFCTPKPMVVHPLYPGDVFDLGQRQIEVIAVSGHTAGEIVLLDRTARALYAGDACNSNTLLHLDQVCVEEYRESLMALKQYMPEFDMLWCGHEVFPSSIIDEGIELCTRVIDGTDDQEETLRFGTPCMYAARHNPDGNGRADGKSFNMTYLPQRIHRAPKAPRVI